MDRRGQKARRDLDQDDAGLPGIDRAEIGSERTLGKLRHGACHFHAGWSTADDDEIEQPAAFHRVGFDLRLFEREQDAAAQVGGIISS
jgi:hypothetical protein